MKMIGMLLGLALLAQVVGAYEVEGNPDKKASIGFGYGRTSQSGSFTINSLNFNDGQTVSTNNFGADIRLPLTSFLTFAVGGGYLWSSTETNFKPFTDRQTSDLKGYNLAVGFRVYIP